MSIVHAAATSAATHQSQCALCATLPSHTISPIQWPCASLQYSTSELVCHSLPVLFQVAWAPRAGRYTVLSKKLHLKMKGTLLLLGVRANCSHPQMGAVYCPIAPLPSCNRKLSYLRMLHSRTLEDRNVGPSAAIFAAFRCLEPMLAYTCQAETLFACPVTC